MLSQNQVVAVRKAIEATYIGLCTVTEHKKITKANHSIGYVEEIVLQNQPCKLSFKSVTTTSQTETANALVQVVKLFLAPEIEIKPGSKITVTQNGVTEDYTNSGVPAVYHTHQEIYLDVFREWA